MALSTITTISSSMLSLFSGILTIPSLVIKHLFNNVENSTDSSFDTLDLTNTSGFITDGIVKAYACTGTALNNHIINYVNLPQSTPGVTIMFKMKLTTTVNYTTWENEYTIANSKSEAVENGFWSINLANNAGTNLPHLLFQIWPSATTGTGNNKLVNRYGIISSANLAYDNTYHHYCFTITETNSTGNYFIITSYKNGTQIGSPLANNGDTSGNHYENFLNMKRISFFRSTFTIPNPGGTIFSFPPARCRIADFRIYQRVLTTTEINTCKTGGEVSS